MGESLILDRHKAMIPMSKSRLVDLYRLSMATPGWELTLQRDLVHCQVRKPEA